MKRSFAMIALLAFASVLHAQVTDATVCGILKDPASFNGKTVRVKGTVAVDFDQFIVKDKNCESSINTLWLSYPAGSHGKAGPMALVQVRPAKNFAGHYQAVTPTPVRLEKDKAFKEFDSYLAGIHKQDLMCLGCFRYEVSATLVGRLDAVAKAGIGRDPSGKIVSIEGFGNLNAYPARLVLQSVSDVTPHEYDFSKADAVVKSQPPEASQSLQEQTMDSVSNAAMINVHSSADNAPNASVDILQALNDLRSAATKRFGATSEITHALERASDAIADHRGVEINYGVANDVQPKEEMAAKHESPDGVIFSCTFNTARLQGPALRTAMLHLGEHIADVRSPEPNITLLTLFDKEYQAWVTTTLQILATGQRTLTISGGYVLWNEFWPQAERQHNLDAAISDFLRQQEMLTR